MAKDKEKWEKLRQKCNAIKVEQERIQYMLQGIIQVKPEYNAAKEMAEELQKIEIYVSTYEILNSNQRYIKVKAPSYLLEQTIENRSGYYECYFHGIGITNACSLAKMIMIIRKIKIILLEKESEIPLLQGETSYSNEGLVTKLLKALYDFETCLLEYVNY